MIGIFLITRIWSKIPLSKCRQDALQTEIELVGTFANVKNLSWLCLFLIGFSVSAQETDYYNPDETPKPVTQEDLNELHRWGPKLGIEAHASIGYSHYYAPPTISGAFSKTTGGFAYDLGAGVRIRLYHKLAMAAGLTYCGRGYDVQYFAGGEDGSGTIYEFDVYEQANLTYIGFYIKPVIEISKKFHLAVLFHPAWRLTYTGESLVVGVAPSSIAGQRDTLQNTPPLEDFEDNLFEIGLELAYKWKISPQLILKPHLGINIATTAIFHTGAELPTPFGGWEQNPSFMSIRFGVIFETGLWMDKPKVGSRF